MHFGAEDSVVLLGLLVAGAALLAIAQVVRVPYPILLVLGEHPLSFVPGIPTIQLSPDLVVFRVAVVPVVTGSFSLAYASASLVLNVIGGTVVGLAAGMVIR